MILQHNGKNGQEALDKLLSLSLAFTVESETQHKTPKLKDGKVEIKGLKAILAHLETLEGELDQWYYCNC